MKGMKTLIVLTFLFSTSIFAGWSEKAKTHLPKDLRALELGKTNRESARKTLGKPDLVRGDKEYWVREGFKYAVELTYKDNKLATLHYNFPKKDFSLEDLKADIDPKLLKSSSTAPHTSLVYEDKEGKLEVDLSSGKVESVRFQ